MSLHMPLHPAEEAGRKQFAEELRCERVRQGLTLVELTDRINESSHVKVVPLSVSAWEDGDAWPLDPSHPRAWARALGK